MNSQDFGYTPNVLLMRSLPIRQRTEAIESNYRKASGSIPRTIIAAA
jgi:hypothetical protein